MPKPRTVSTSIDIEQRVRGLAKSWGVTLPEPLTMTLATFAFLEHLYVRQENITRLLQSVHSEQTKMWTQLRKNQ
jgi:hypothetical protein